MNSLKLYLLVFANGLHFKVGITESKGLGRVKALSRLYDIDFSKSYLISASSSTTIRLLERVLLNDFTDYSKKDEYKGKDGATEILDIACLLDVLADVKHRKAKSHLQIEVHSGVTAFDEMNATYERLAVNLVTKHKYVQIQWVNLEGLFSAVSAMMSSKKKIKIFRIIDNKNNEGFIIIDNLGNDDGRKTGVLKLLFDNWRFSYMYDSSRRKRGGESCGGRNLIGGYSGFELDGANYCYVELFFSYNMEEANEYLNFDGVYDYFRKMENFLCANVDDSLNANELIVKDRFGLIQDIKALVKAAF